MIIYQVYNKFIQNGGIKMKSIKKSLISLNGNKGFTLIELLIVIIILAVLAGLAIPMYTAQVERSRAAEAIQSLDAWRGSALRYFSANGAYTGMAIDNMDYNPNTAVGGQTIIFAYTVPAADVAANTFTLTATRAGQGTVTINQLGNVTRTGAYL